MALWSLDGRKAAFGMMLFVSCVLLGSRELISVLGTKDYLDAIYYIIPLVVGGYFAFLYNLPAQVEYYYEKTKYIAVGTCVAAMMNVVMNYIGIKAFGSIAAAYTTLVIYIAYFFIHYFLSVKIHGCLIFRLQHITVYGLFLGLVAAIALLLNDSSVIRWCLICIIVVFSAVWIKREVV